MPFFFCTHSHSPFHTPHFPLPFPTFIYHSPGCYPMLPHCLPCRVSRGAATLPHRLPLRSIPPPRFACGSSHSRGHGRPRSVRKSSRLRGKCLFTELLLLRHSKSFGPSAPIAYATSVSPPDEAIAWPGFRCWVLDDAVSSQGRRCWVANDAAGCPWQSSCKSPRTLQKCKLLITKQLTFGAVLGEHKLSSSSTRLKVNHLCIRYLYIKSVRGDLHEGHFSLPDATFPSSRAQKPRFCAREAEFVR